MLLFVFFVYLVFFFICYIHIQCFWLSCKSSWIMERIRSNLVSKCKTQSFIIYGYIQIFLQKLNQELCNKPLNLAPIFTKKSYKSSSHHMAGLYKKHHFLHSTVVQCTSVILQSIRLCQSEEMFHVKYKIK